MPLPGAMAAWVLDKAEGDSYILTAMSDTRPRKASTTAILVAAVRASHLRWNPSDQYASAMVTPFWRAVATTGC